MATSFVSASVTGAQNCITSLNNTGRWCITSLQQELSARCRQVSKEIQEMINKDVSGGAVNFTMRAVMFNFIKLPNDIRENQIIVKPDQTKYLERILTDDKQTFEKFVPTSNAKLDKYGNIQGMHRNIKSKKYQIVKQGTKTYMIDTSKKGKNNNDKRIIAVENDNETRNELFDFYDECALLATEQISDLKGNFTMEIK
ncbi:hypothetical protein E0U70_20175 [Salmonella enterica subsp. enterica serovar Gloucester]|nr:hypothetical protein [Salmonella enterica subsp. enterica serovar Gloucester]